MTDAVPRLPRADLMLILAAAGVLAAVTLAIWGWKAWRRRRTLHRTIRAVTTAGFNHLRGVLVPDGNGGSMHVDFLLLTARGILVVDLRDIPGNVFGGDQMDEWTVMDGPRRSTFVNPQAALYDRVAAVRAITGEEVPIEGRVLFTRRARFPKGLPKWTLMLDSLGAEFPTADTQILGEVLQRFEPGWQQLKQAVTPSRLDPRLR